jgi:hypothetical protein
MSKLYVSNKDESVRMFRNNFLELFTHVHHIVPVILFVPVVALMFKETYQEGMGIGRAAILFVAGLFIWSVVEYTVHRFGFHVSRDAEVKVQESVEHLGESDPALPAIGPIPMTRSVW